MELLGITPTKIFATEENEPIKITLVKAECWQWKQIERSSTSFAFYTNFSSSMRFAFSPASILFERHRFDRILGARLASRDTILLNIICVLLKL